MQLHRYLTVDRASKPLTGDLTHPEPVVVSFPSLRQDRCGFLSR